MRSKVETWRSLLYVVRVEDVIGKSWEGKIDSQDDTGIALRIGKGNKEIILLPWTAIYTIKPV